MSSKLTYRPDIDGLRALAVLSVIIFHLKASWLPGGFLGVDIFFVISGYLITTIIYKQMEEGSFSFSDFYNKRVKRILPVFFVVLLVGLGVSAYVMMPLDASEVSKTAVGAVMYISNFFFARASTDYFHAASEEKPFLHIWSLSVEEQYYFIFPIVLFLLFRFSILRKYILQIILGIFLFLIAISFIDLENWGFKLDRYYLSHLRFIEICVGSLLAIVTIKYKCNIPKNRYNVISVFSLVILLGLFIMGRDILTPEYFPGILALLPTIATAGLIFANAQRHWVSDIFSSRILVWIGKISYSLYLWHWVILAVFRYLWQESDLPIGWIFMAVIITFGLSVMSYYWVEAPMRKIKFSLAKNFIYFYAIPSVIVLLIFYNLKEEREPEPESNQTFVLGNVNSRDKILVLGDSHSFYFKNFIDIVGKNEGWNAYLDATIGCPFVFKEILHNSYCNERNNNFFQKYDNYSTIVIINFFGGDGTLPQEFEHTIKILSEKGKNVYVLNTSNLTTFYGNRTKFFSDKQGLLKYIATHKKEFLKINGVFREKNIEKVENIRRVVMKYPSVKWIDLTPLLREVLEKNDYQNILFDDNHFTDYGAEQMAQEFINSKRKLIIKS